MKKILYILSSVFFIPTSSILTTACDPIISIASKSFTGTTDDLNIFFNDKSTIKPYSLQYLEFINDSWEHNGFESSLFSTKIQNSKITPDLDNETEVEFIKILSEIYKPAISDTTYDFTGMTIVVENIFLNSIKVDVNENENRSYATNIESDLALTIKKGWKEQGKILATVTTSKPIEKDETFKFINKIIEGLNFKLKVSDEPIEEAEIDSKNYYEIQGSLSKDEQNAFINKLILTANSRLSLDLTGLINFPDDDNGKTMEIDGIKYKFVQ
ncbi:hypothetical protein [Spiroplasma diminutum]|uniref:Lipoprotein n=1 Tax=Spiroplasma diminutum CUAS-1 TaxID=1276221 RepID=S5MJF5_9MOLU|nr:hypothetical protein [Spiroplasma diminutum]AGR42110.1 hypothetical protein SDIMI_v3c04060 [Spiroplasma diminutum CUAS-1]